MLNANEKKTVMEKLINDLYTDYLKLSCVNIYVDNKYAEILLEDEEKLRADLKTKRDEISDFEEAMRDKVMEEDQVETKKQMLAEAKELENKINVINQAKIEIQKQKERLEETVAHYQLLTNWLKEKEYEKDPQV